MGMKTHYQKGNPWTPLMQSSSSSPTSIADKLPGGALHDDDDEAELMDQNGQKNIATTSAVTGASPEKKKKKRKRKKKKKKSQQVVEPSPLEETSVSTSKDDHEKVIVTTTNDACAENLKSVETDTSNRSEDDDDTAELKQQQQPPDHEAAAAAAAAPSIDSQPTPPISKMLKLFQPEWPVCVFCLLLMFATEVTNVQNPAMVASAYDMLTDSTLQLTPQERMSKINTTMMWVMIVHCLGNLFAFLRFSLVGVVSERVVTRLRCRLYACLLRQEISFYDQNNSGDIASHLASDTGLIQEAVSNALPEVVVGGVKLIATSIAMLWIAPTLALVTVTCVGLSILLSTLFAQWMGDWTYNYYQIYGKAQSHCYEALGAMRLVQSFAAENKEEERFRQRMGDANSWWPKRLKRDGTDTTYDTGITKSFVNATFYTFIFFSGFGSVYISIWYGFKIVVDERITFGEFASFQALMIQVGITILTVSRMVKQFVDNQSASARLFYLLERIPEIPIPPAVSDAADGKDAPSDGKTTKSLTSAAYVPPTPLLKPDSMQGAIELRNVTFSYPTRPGVTVLDGVSLKIPPNSTAALVGPSGAGKSTVVSLLQRFYDVSSGSVRIDGRDIRDLDLKWLRSHVGYVQQEPQLFGISIRENICYGVDREVSQEELESVCRKANAHNFVSKWPNGYDTLVGERGVQLSGGQKQRIAIARALLVNPRVLLLDEATSALDAESEHLVQEAIDNAVHGRTVVIIAHRLSTIKNAGQIVVVDDHKIVDVGTHDVLLGRCPKYQHLINRQSFKH